MRFHLSFGPTRASVSSVVVIGSILLVLLGCGSQQQNHVVAASSSSESYPHDPFPSLSLTRDSFSASLLRQDHVQGMQSGLIMATDDGRT